MRTDPEPHNLFCSLDTEGPIVARKFARNKSAPPRVPCANGGWDDADYRGTCGRSHVPGAGYPHLIPQSIPEISKWYGISKQVRIQRFRPSRAIFFEGLGGEVGHSLLRSSK